jgi:putative heme utilization carrier protein HutX
MNKEPTITTSDEELPMATLSRRERLERLTERLTRPHQGTLETLAEKYAFSLYEATGCLAEGQRRHFDGDQMVSVLETISEWGEVLLLINNKDGVFECKGTIPKGTVGRGYYNLGSGSPISGHLCHDKCQGIYCLRRSFKKKETCSVQFFNQEGEAMFKIFLGRDAQGGILPEQLTQFEAFSGLRQSVA